MRTLLKTCAMILTAILIAGCATKKTVVIDTASDWVRLNKPAKASVSVYQNGAWVEAGTMELPAGWVAGPGKEE